MLCSDRASLLLDETYDLWLELTELKDFLPSDTRYSDEIRARGTEQPLIGGAVQVLLGPVAQDPQQPTAESSVAGVVVYWAWSLQRYMGRSVPAAIDWIRDYIEELPEIVPTELCDDLRALNVRMEKVLGSYVPAKPCNNPDCDGKMIDTPEGAMCPICGIDQSWSVYFDELVARASI